MENILFFPIWTHFQPHFETDLEIMVNEVKNVNKAYFIFCNKFFKICDNNIQLEKYKCKQCIKAKKKALELINNENIYIVNLNKYQECKIDVINMIKTIDELNNINDLKKLKYKSNFIGYSIASSLEKEIDIYPFETLKPKINNLYYSSIIFYECILKIIDDFSISKGYIFNGRFCLSRAFYQAFIDKNLNIFTHDRGSTQYKYSLYKNKLPHDINEFSKYVINYWEENNDINYKKQCADIFFKSRFIGSDTSFFSFTSDQNINRIPLEINKYKKIIAIYCSSDYEFDYISDDYTYKYYLSQNDGIKNIVTSLKNDDDIGIFLREHPNQKNKMNFQRDELRNISAKNFYIIPAESDISSYKLLLNANVVITFNSTMGIEATYWGIPSILCSNAIYENLNISYIPASHEEVISLIKSDLKPIISDDVLKYGYYSGTFGIKFKYYKPLNFANGLFINTFLLHNNNLFYFLKKIFSKIKFFIKFHLYKFYKILKYLNNIFKIKRYK